MTSAEFDRAALGGFSTLLQRGTAVAGTTDNPNYPVPGNYYRHYKGGLYGVLALGKNEADLADVVVYKSYEDGSVWVRPVDSWLEKVWAAGGNSLTPRVPRFALVDGPWHRAGEPGPVPEPAATVDVALEASDLIRELRRDGFGDCRFPDVRASCVDEWGERYAMLGDLYYLADDFAETPAYFDSSRFRDDFEGHVKKRFPGCRVTVNWTSQELEIVRLESR